MGKRVQSLQPRTSPFKVTNEDTLFQHYHPELSAQILGFLKVEITNLRSEFHHIERASPTVLGTIPKVILRVVFVGKLIAITHNQFPPLLRKSLG
jgi:hypothetical protein